MTASASSRTTDPMLLDRGGAVQKEKAQRVGLTIEASIVTSFPDIIGDSPAYDAANERLLWVDTARGLVHELTWDEESQRELGRTWSVASWATAVVPRARGGFVVATNRDVVAISDDGSSERLTSLPVEDRRPRWRDLTCDPKGRLVGGWVPDHHNGTGEFVRVEPDGGFTTIVPGIGVPGGCDWSPDGSTFYASDGYAVSVYAFDYDDAGNVENQRTVIQIEPGAGLPTGLIVDDEGCIWVAVMWAGEVRRYSPDGEPLAAVRMPTATPVACAFGGPERDELFISSSWLKSPRSALVRAGVTEDRIEAALFDTFGGALYVCRPGVTGPPITAFAG